MPITADIAPYAEGAAMSMLLQDWQQTGARKHDYYEKNPILGKSPSQDKINAYMATAAAAQYGLYKLLPDEYKLPFALATAAVEGHQINSNRNVGLPINFKALIPLAALLGKTIVGTSKNNVSLGVEKTPDNKNYIPKVSMEW
jgi:hypothetical protein